MARLVPVLAAILSCALAPAATAAPILFTDATPGSGLEWNADQPTLRTGVGVALFDHDGDGLLDVLVGGGTIAPVRLWRNLGGGSFQAQAASKTGLTTFSGDIRGFGAADYDNDGDVDLFLCAWAKDGKSVLLRNDGGTFVDVTDAAGIAVVGRTNGAAFGDYDGDGLLDLYLSRYEFHQNQLFRNTGGGVFENVTVAAGLVLPGTTTSKAQTLHATWLDVDRDGDLDLYEDNDRCYSGSSRNLLFVNQANGTFLEQAPAFGLDLCFDAMGAAVADYDRNGWPDLFMTNIAYGHQLYAGGCGGYEDRSLDAGTLSMQWGWGVVFDDLDDDGWPDLYVAHEKLMSGSSKDRIFHNRGDGTFDDVTAEAYGGIDGETFTVASGDLDGDGDLDLIAVDLGAGQGQSVRFLRNDSDGGHSLRVALVGTTSNREGIGAWVDVLAGGSWRRGLRTESSTYGGRKEAVLHFGLGPTTVADRVVVHWPSGATQTLHGVSTGGIVTVVEADEGGPAPWPELCGDGLDNDCDGVTDPGGPVGAACDPEGCDAPGIVVCTDDLTASACAPVVEPWPGGPPGSEPCDGVDNDCDGLTDEGYTGLGEPCSAGQGGCAATGEGVCHPTGTRAVCSATPKASEPELCDGLDNDCDVAVDEGFPLGEPCTVGVGDCAADGVLACDAAGGVACDAEPGAPAAELCDGRDNDCDGGTDEDFPLLGGPCVAGLGPCAVAGEVVCAEGGTACAGEPLPGEAELCDGVDNDCDGDTDEDFPGVGDVCVAGEGPCAVGGLVLCGAGGLSAACVAVELPPDTELCNGVDDDCDGDTDEGFVVGEPCTAGVGACAATGATACAGDGAGTRCNAPTVQPGAELCGNGADDDCDGDTDEGFALGAPCTAGVGACARDGQTVCAPGGQGTACAALPAEPAPERCGNGTDDDCDGDTDEGFPLGEPCTVGSGACVAAGVLGCAADGLSVACLAEPLPPGEELCGNGADDDCDGDTDEGYAVGQACTVGAGACTAAGTTACSPDGRSVVCDGEPGPAGPERCGDGVDDDCDGETDEGFDLGAPCVAGLGACAAEGRTVCSLDRHAVACDAVPGEGQAELCGNGVDDDCDGETDEGFDTGAACPVGVGACAAIGVTACAPDGAGLVCVGAGGAPGTELCGNGVDDDCDGEVDEGFDLGAPCTVGVGACAADGHTVCAADGLGAACDAQAAPPGVEACGDGVDDDCDGEVDEGFDLGAPCWVGIGGCQRQGVVVCGAAGHGVCGAEPGAPGVEQPGNGLDDDCDGEVDEAPGGGAPGGTEDAAPGADAAAADAGGPEASGGGDAGGESGDPGAGASGDTGGGQGPGAGSGAGPADTGGDGGCRATSGATPGAAALALFVLLGQRRRLRLALLAAVLGGCASPAPRGSADAGADVTAPEAGIADTGGGRGELEGEAGEESRGDAGGETATRADAAAGSAWRVLLSGLPQAALSVWSGSPGELWVAGGDKGAGPLLLHRADGAWTALQPGTAGHLWWVHGTGGDVVWVSGEHGRVLRHDRSQGTFEALDTGVDVPLYGIWGASDDDLWAVGGQTFPTDGPGVLVHVVDGVPAVVSDLPASVSPTAAFFKVWGTGPDDVWVVGEEGTVLHHDGAGWTHVVLPGAPRLVTLAGAGADDMVVVGGLSKGAIFERRGGPWVDAAAGLPEALQGPMLQGVSVGQDGRAVAVGIVGWALERRGGVWSELPEAPILKDWHAAHVDEAGDVYVVGGNLLSAAAFDDGAVLCYGGGGCLGGPPGQPGEDAGAGGDTSAGDTLATPDAAGGDDGGAAADGAPADASQDAPDATWDAPGPADAAPDVGLPDTVAQDFPLTLGAPGPGGAFTPLAEGQPVEIVQGPQGGIHVDLALAFEVPGYPDKLFVAADARTYIDGVEVGLALFQKLLATGAGGAYQCQAIPVIFYQNQASDYLAPAPEQTFATICAQVTVDELQASTCRMVELVDLQ